MSNAAEAAKSMELRNAILELFDTLSTGVKGGVSLKVIQIALTRAGISATTGELNREINYLEDKGYVKVRDVENKALHISARLYSITADGVDVLEGTKADEGVGVG